MSPRLGADYVDGAQSRARGDLGEEGPPGEAHRSQRSGLDRRGSPGRADPDASHAWGEPAVDERSLWPACHTCGLGVGEWQEALEKGDDDVQPVADFDG
ncbi:MAG: hypothetical protein H0T69_08465 [Thermoleophilaceae bacterium]|nr:hypothetical protein [Thermoleophilaceae bacterium]